MKVHTLEREQHLAAAPSEVFPFFADPANLERITPPVLRFEVLTPSPLEMRIGTLIRYRLRVHGIPIDWLTRIDDWEPGVRFVDTQLVGPYKLWHHAHTFEEHEGGTLMRDVVHFALPAWPLGELALPILRRDLNAIFDHRRDAVAYYT